jgi:5-methylcytosine-specific restriction protein B
MTPPDFASPSAQAVKVLQLLRNYHNVLISGAPATGKSRLLAEARHWFAGTVSPAFTPSGPNAFPARKQVAGATDWLPSPSRTDRNSWSITFHQGTKYRDFIGGLMQRVRSIAQLVASYKTPGTYVATRRVKQIFTRLLVP